jgi:hypothetical protein
MGFRMPYFNRRLVLLPILLCLVFSQVRLLGATAEDYYNRGLALYQKQNYLDALPYLQESVSLNPKYWQAFEILARCENAIENYIDALDHCEISLALHPENPSLLQLALELKPKVYTPPIMPRSAKAPSGPQEGPPLAPPFWIKGSFLFDYSSEEDIDHAAGGWNATAKSLGGIDINSSAGNVGFGGKLEIGHNLDPANALSLVISDFGLDGFEGSAQIGTAQEAVTIQPSFISLGIKYYHYWAHENDRAYLNAGLDYDYGMFTISNAAPGFSYPPYDEVPSGYSLGKGDFGLNIGAGYELRIATNIGLELSISLYYASISTVSNNGLGLVVYPNGYMGVAPTTQINQNGVRWAVFDLTGFQSDLGMMFYIF